MSDFSPSPARSGAPASDAGGAACGREQQLYRYAEDLQVALQRNQSLEANCELLREVCARLSERRELSEAMTARSPDLHLLTDLEGRIVQGNPAADLLAPSGVLLGTTLRSWVRVSHREPHDALCAHAAGERAAGDGRLPEWELVLQRAEPGAADLIVIAQVFPVRREGRLRHLHWVLRDVTGLRAVQEESQVAGMVFRSASEGVMITSVDGEIVAVNPAFSQITGYAPEEVIGRQPSLLRSGMHDARFYAEFWSALQERGRWQGEIYNRRKNGEVYPEWLTVDVARDGEGRALSYIAVFSDLSRILATERRLAHLAHHDMLTGLPNRLLFQDRLALAVATARRGGLPFTLIFIDLDRFKQINDTLGHEIGDVVLKEVAARLNATVREVDTVARLGGDEFVVIAPELAGAAAIERVGHKLIEALSAPIVINEHELVVGGSLGCATFPQHADDEALLLRRADQAMYRAKAAGGNVCLIHESGTEAGVAPLRLESELRHALERGQLRLEYQPQVAAAGGGLLGVEALLRWDHPQLGAIPPLQFIPVAERTGLILPIGAWVLQTACAQLAAWDALGLPRLSMAVNLAPRQLRDPELLAVVRGALAASGIAPERLELEVTESELMQQLEHGCARLHALRELGVRIAIDDFGTGYSSLARLMHLPVDCLKLDRGFISALEAEGGARAGAITAAIVRMGRALGVDLVAEGVETVSQYDLLTAQGCDVIQGFLTGRPMPPEALPRWFGRTAARCPGGAASC